MVNKSPTKYTVLFLLFALVVFSMACSRNAADIIKEQSDAYLGNNNSDRDRPIMPTATFTAKPPAPPVENPAPPPDQAQPAAPTATPPGQQPQPAAPSATPPGQKPASASPATVVGGWYGPYCDEAEGTYYYRWSVDLMQNPADGSYAGTVKFHNCPGGGRVAYRVTGPSQPGPLLSLNGTLMDGGGALHDSAAASLTFTFDLAAGQITPNLAP